MTKQYVLEWSKKTNNFHIQPLSNLLAHNQSAFVCDQQTQDYIVIFSGTQDAVHEMANHWRTRIREREAFMPEKVAI